ncbi:MAG TPA: hypothetical protein VIM16_01720 [Mucilaginibacter sp.]|jgi:hypothetical protein
MKRKIVTTAALLCCFAVCLAAALAGLNGKWIGSIKTPNGKDYPITYTINVSGDKLTGSVQVTGAPKTINNGKITGTDFTFAITANDGKTIPHAGKYYADGDSIAMNVDYEGTKLHTTLKRADK